MGYTLWIGNAVPEFSKEYGELHASWSVEPTTAPDAPTFPHDEMTKNSNGRSPSYSGWADTCREAGLYEVFFNERDGLLREHPGCQMLLPEHHLQFKAALERWQRQATLPPGFEGWPVYNEETKTHETPDRGKYDAVLARLIWLEWWTAWALKNCETPAFSNS